MHPEADRAAPAVRRLLGIPLAWWVAVGTTIGLGLGYSGFTVAVIGQFLRPIAETYGWTRAETSGGFSIALMVVVVAAPLSGMAVDRWTAPRVLLFGALTMPVMVTLLALIDGRLWMLYTVMGLIALFGAATLPATYTSITLRWFDNYRGVGFGFALAGAGVAQIALPPIIQASIKAVDWRFAVLLLAAIMFVVVVPIAIAFRAKPKGSWELDGGMTPPAHHATRPQALNIGWNEGLRSRHFWQPLALFTLLGIGTFGLLANYPAMLRDAGFSPTAMVQLIALQGAITIAARIGTGWILDRFSPRLAAGIIVGCPAFGMLLLMSGLDASLPKAALASSLIAIGIGGEMNVMSFVVSRYFERAVYARFAGAMHSTFNVGGAIGTPVLAAFYDRYGSYDHGLAMMAFAVAVAALLAFLLPGFERDRDKAVARA